MSSVEHDVLAWAMGRDLWQQDVMRKVAAGQLLEQTEIEELAANLIEGRVSVGEAITASEIPRSQEQRKTVSLKVVGDFEHVNALLPNQRIEFGETGLTLIYGDNGSGKSGFARVIKQMSGARHDEDVLRNVFEESADAEEQQVVTLKFLINGEDGFDPEADEPLEPLRAVQFYDEACGDVYIEEKSEITYRPSVLRILDGLVAVCGRVDTFLNAKLQELGESRPTLPATPTGSSSEQFLAELSHKTSESEIKEACRLPKDSAEQLAQAIKEESRLLTSDPAKEKTRLRARVADLTILLRRCEALDSQLSRKSVAAAVDLGATGAMLRTAANSASAQQFKNEPIFGIGSESWQSLWEAAREFSLDAYHDTHFPVVADGAVCVLCQQALSEDAADRLKRFEAFVADTTEQKAREAEAALASRLGTLVALGDTPLDVSEKVAAVRQFDAPLADQLTTWLGEAESLRVALIAKLRKESDELPPLGAGPAVALKNAISATESKAGKLDDEAFRLSLNQATATKDDIEGRTALAKHRKQIAEAIDLLKQESKIGIAKKLVATTAITKQSTHIFETHATDAVRERFAKEAARLKVPRIELSMDSAKKAKQFHSPSLVGAKRAHHPKDVLSEGEQTAVGLAGYFTEATLDMSKSALVLDDPVTSLDHKRRNLVAERLAEFAVDRQVAVFTHDIVFLRYLLRAADERSIEPKEFYILRKLSSPGLVKSKFPWKAKDSKARVGDLRTRLEQIERDHAAEAWDDDRYSDEVRRWVGDLSELWEGMVEELIVNEVVKPGTSAVQTDKFKILARVSDADHAQLEASYSFCSEHAPRHRNSAPTNPSTPDVAELRAQVEGASAWRERIRKYRA